MWSIGERLAGSRMVEAPPGLVDQLGGVLEHVFAIGEREGGALGRASGRSLMSRCGQPSAGGAVRVRSDTAARVIRAVSSKPALIFQHGRLGPPARVAEWLDERGMPYVVHHAGSDGAVTPTDFSFVVSLGSQHSAAAS